MKVWVDDRYYKVEKSLTIFQFCALIGINLPCFCYHEKLTIAGNCRICMVEVSTAANLVVSCAMPLLDNMRIYTQNKRVLKARENILEFLLINHPLDCPICDQGGECDLQDLSLTIGSDKGRFYEYAKRSVDNLHCFGPLIKTVMTRCIQCTRCVRFINEYSNNFDFGVIGRGVSMEVGTYVSNFIDDELSGNIIDLCPVGALTSMPYAYTARPWELKKYVGVDVLDSLGSSIRLDVSNNKISRIVPILDESVNEEWITNKARFSYDSLYNQRLFYPKWKIGNRNSVISWNVAAKYFWENFFTNSFFGVFCGSFLDLQAVLYLKSFVNSFGSSNFFLMDNPFFDLVDFKFYYLLNSSLESLETKFNVLFIGLNIRLEIPLLNLRLRKAYMLYDFFSAYSIGCSLNFLTYPVQNISNSFSDIVNLFEGKSAYSSNFFLNDFFSLVFFKCNLRILDLFIGLTFSLVNFIYYAKHIVLNAFLFMRNLHLNISNLHLVFSKIGNISMLEFGVVKNFLALPANLFRGTSVVKSKPILYFVGLDLDVIKLNLFNQSAFLVYQGFFYHPLVDKFNLVLPVSVYTESDFHFINLEGRYRVSEAAVMPSDKIFPDWKLFRFLFLSKKLYTKHISWPKLNLVTGISYDCWFLSSLNNSKTLSKFFSDFYLNYFPEADWHVYSYKFYLYFNLVNRVIVNYYMSDIFCKYSKVMALSASNVNINSFTVDSGFFNSFNELSSYKSINKNYFAF